MKKFQKILVAEDFDAYNVAVRDALSTLDIAETAHVSYCDDALIKLKKSLQDEEPFDLLITDLSFKPDHRKIVLTSGQELIAAAMEIQPSLKVIVYSIEDRPHLVQYLFEELDIDGYILKGRENIPEIRKAIDKIQSGSRYISHELSHVLNNKSLDEIDATDRKLLGLLSKGLTQVQISDIFKTEGTKGASTSSIEKRIARLKVILRAESKNIGPLIAVAKELGLA